MSITLDEFIESVTTSGLMDAEELRSFLDLLPMEQQPGTAEDLAKELFRQGKLTKFQAQAIYQRKTRGLVVGNYVVLDKLGKGGMGAVYKAKHRRMDRVVALKMLPSSATKSADAVQRFQREARAAAKLSHPNIVTAYDADEAKGVHFLVMEYVEGQDLHALVKEHGTISVACAVDYITQAAKGLEYAHDQGIIHRDIKPHNLLLDKKGTVTILDMGLARIGEGADDAVDDDGLTRSGQVLGTLDYMSPEQALDTKTADARADIYSLGCTLHYLLIGNSPYGGDTVGKKMLAHRMAPIPSLRKLRSDVPQSLDTVFHKMLAKDPKDRQQSMTEVISELQGCVLSQGNLPAQPSCPPNSGSYAETVNLQKEEAAYDTRLRQELQGKRGRAPTLAPEQSKRVATLATRLLGHWSKVRPSARVLIGATAAAVMLLGVIVYVAVHQASTQYSVSSGPDIRDRFTHVKEYLTADEYTLWEKLWAKSFQEPAMKHLTVTEFQLMAYLVLDCQVKTFRFLKNGKREEDHKEAQQALRVARAYADVLSRTRGVDFKRECAPFFDENQMEERILKEGDSQREEM